MATVVDLMPVTRALVVMLTAATGRPFAAGGSPFGDGQVPQHPYGYVEVVLGSGAWPDAGAPDRVVERVWQVTAVAERHDQAEWLADRVRRAILRRAPGTAGVSVGGFVHPIVPAVDGAETASGMSAAQVIARRQDSTGGVDREGHLFNAADRYVLTIAG